MTQIFFFPLKLGNSEVMRYDWVRWSADFDKMTVASLLTSSYIFIIHAIILVGI